MEGRHHARYCVCGGGGPTLDLLVRSLADRSWCRHGRGNWSPLLPADRRPSLLVEGVPARSGASGQTSDPSIKKGGCKKVMYGSYDTLVRTSRRAVFRPLAATVNGLKTVAV